MNVVLSAEIIYLDGFVLVSQIVLSVGMFSILRQASVEVTSKMFGESAEEYSGFAHASCRGGGSKSRDARPCRVSGHPDDLFPFQCPEDQTRKRFEPRHLCGVREQTIQKDI